MYKCFELIVFLSILASSVLLPEVGEFYDIASTSRNESV